MISQINLHAADVNAFDALRLQFLNRSDGFFLGGKITAFALSVDCPRPGERLFLGFVVTSGFNARNRSQQVLFDLVLLLNFSCGLHTDISIVNFQIIGFCLYGLN